MTFTAKQSWPEEPYKGLSYYDQDDLAIFAGRNREIDDAVSLLAHTSTRTILLHGRTGCGKSSFLRAGLIPRIMTEGFDFEFLIRRSASEFQPLFIRSGARPLERLAEELYSFAERPYSYKTRHDTREIDLSAVFLNCSSIADARRQASDSGFLIGVVLELSRRLPTTLVFILDQAEEVITLNRGDTDLPHRDEFFEFLREFTTTPSTVKLIVAFRSEFGTDFLDCLNRNYILQTEAILFPLTNLKRDAIVDAIKRPTMREPVESYGVPYQKYGFEFEKGLPERIADEVLAREHKGGSLPVVQIVCQTLFEMVVREQRKKTISGEDYDALGGLAGQIDTYIKRRLEKVFSDMQIPQHQRAEEEERWRYALSTLALPRPDGQVVTDLVALDTMVERAHERGVVSTPMPVIEYLAKTYVRILRPESLINPETNSPISCYSLGHDAIALVLERWQTAAGARMEAIRVAKRRLRKQILLITPAIMTLLLVVVVLALQRQDYRLKFEATKSEISRLLLGSEDNLGKNYSLGVLLAAEAARLEQNLDGLKEHPARDRLIELIARSPYFLMRLEGARYASSTSEADVIICCDNEEYISIDTERLMLERYMLIHPPSNVFIEITKTPTGHGLIVKPLINENEITILTNDVNIEVGLGKYINSFAKQLDIDVRDISTSLVRDKVIMYANDFRHLRVLDIIPSVATIVEFDDPRDVDLGDFWSKLIDDEKRYGGISTDGNMMVFAYESKNELLWSYWKLESTAAAKRYRQEWPGSYPLNSHPTNDKTGLEPTRSDRSEPVISFSNDLSFGLFKLTEKTLLWIDLDEQRSNVTKVPEQFLVNGICAISDKGVAVVSSSSGYFQIDSTSRLSERGVILGPASLKMALFADGELIAVDSRINTEVVAIWRLEEPLKDRIAAFSDFGTDKLIEQACKLAGRPIEDEEWAVSFGKEEKREICPNREGGVFFVKNVPDELSERGASSNQ